MSNSVSNPYAPTSAVLVLPGAGGDVEATRKMYLTHEASVKSIGTLYMLGAILGGLSTVVYLIMAAAALSSPQGEFSGIFMIVASVFAAGFTVLYYFMARGLWALQPWSRTVATIFSALGLIGFPLGTIISAYFLYLLLSQKGAVVFSDDYKRVIQATPHIKYKTSIVVWILLGLLVLLLVGGIMAIAVGSATAR